LRAQSRRFQSEDARQAIAARIKELREAKNLPE